jgi:hypothetical protein
MNHCGYSLMDAEAIINSKSYSGNMVQTYNVISEIYKRKTTKLMSE